jgi:dsRNA-specific ribonuclease
MEVFSAAFTSELVDPLQNFQVLEQLGDLSANKFIVMYLYRRFPQLKCAEGVKVAARLRINFGSKQSFFKIAEDLGFWEFISATNDLRQRKMKALLEDVFEAFLGAVETIFDDRVKMGLGYSVVYKILENIFDEIEISLAYESLYDAKTRLKELFDLHGEKLGPLVYKEDKNELLTTSTVYRVDGGKYEVRPNGSINFNRIIGGKYHKIGEGKAALKADAQQNAAKIALETLSKQGWVKHPPRIYKQFASGEVKEEEEVTVESVKKILKETGINELRTTKSKSKYQSKYMGTMISGYCRDRNVSGVKACLELKADPNVKDTDGIKPLDLLFIGKVEPKKVKRILKHLIKGGCDLEIQKAVYDAYYVRYAEGASAEGDYFVEVQKKLKVVE